MQINARNGDNTGGAARFFATGLPVKRNAADRGKESDPGFLVHSLRQATFRAPVEIFRIVCVDNDGSSLLITH